MLIVLLFFMGLAVGSFLNVLIDRLPRNESVFKGRSYCESCKKKIKWYDLVPVLSFILLWGKCRHCQSPISFYYPAVEMFTGVMFILTFLLIPDLNIKYQISNIKYFTHLFYYLFIVSSLIVIFFTDLKYGIIPNKITYPAVLISIFFLMSQYPDIPISNFTSALLSALFFFFLFILTKGRGMGFGDVKLTFLLGLFLGFPLIIVALYAAFLTGAVASLMLIITGRKKLRGSTIPFGPFLVTGAIIVVFSGDLILSRILLYFSL